MTANTAAPSALDEALARLINRSVDAAESVAGNIGNATGTAIDFLSAEVPDLIQQLLIWRALDSFIWFLLGLVLMAAPWLVYWKWGGRGQEVPPGLHDSGPRYQETLTHDCWGRRCPDTTGALAVLAALVNVVAIPIVLSNLTWLQILVAPKLYLFEYARKLIS